MTRTSYRIFETEYPYFLTCTVVAWLPVFAYPKYAEVILESWRFLQRERNVTIFGYVILENHLHGIASSPDLEKQVGHFKSHTARRIIDGLSEAGHRTLLEEFRYFKLRHQTDQEHQLWQEGSHPKKIGDEEMLRQKLHAVD